MNSQFRCPARSSSALLEGPVGMYLGAVAALIYPVALRSFHVSVVSAYEPGGRATAALAAATIHLPRHSSCQLRSCLQRCGLLASRSQVTSSVASGKLRSSPLRRRSFCFSRCLALHLWKSRSGRRVVGGHVDRRYRQLSDARKCKPENKRRPARFVALRGSARSTRLPRPC